MTGLQHPPEGLFTRALDQGEDLVFRLKFRFPMGNDDLFPPDDGDEN